MSRYRDVELSSFGNVQLMSKCRDVRRDVEMSRCRDVEMSRCRDVERSRFWPRTRTRLIAGSWKPWHIQKSQNGGKGLYSISSLKHSFLPVTSGSWEVPTSLRCTYLTCRRKYNHACIVTFPIRVGEMKHWKMVNQNINHLEFSSFWKPEVISFVHTQFIRQWIHLRDRCTGTLVYCFNSQNK